MIEDYKKNTSNIDPAKIISGKIVMIKKTGKTIFGIYISSMFLLITVVAINTFYPFQTTKVNLSYNNNLVKTIDGIIKKALSFKEAQYFEVIEER